MKHNVASGSNSRTCRTSAIEATSKWVMPESHRICSRSGEGFAFTAYIDLPGKFSAKKRAARAAACGRLQITGSSGARARTTAVASGYMCNSRDPQQNERYELPCGWKSPWGSEEARIYAANSELQAKTCSAPHGCNELSTMRDFAGLSAPPMR